MDKTILFVLCFIFCGISSAQKTYEFKGRIIAQTQDTLEISILNLTKQTGVVNDEKGYFKIDVSLGDKMYFSSVQFEPHELEITEAILTEDPYQVFLFPKINALQEVIITDSGLIGLADVDVDNIPVTPFITAQNLGLPTASRPLPTVEERRIYTASSSMTELLINTINGKLKKLRQLDRWAKLDKIVLKGEQSMASFYFEEYCGIPKEYITDFVYFCAEDERYKRLLQLEDQLKLFEFFEEKGPEYRASRNWD